MTNNISPAPGPTATTQTTNDPIQQFETFFHGWLARQQQFLGQLLRLQTHTHSESLLKEHTSLLTDHYKEYYQAKSRITRYDAFLVFSPPWFTSYERMFLWIAGFKPSHLFKIINSTWPELTPDQTGRMQLLAAETTVGEAQLMEHLIRVQQEITALPSVTLARTKDAAIDRIMADMEVMVMGADDLREKTVLRVIEILDARQTLRFFTVTAQLQLAIRGRGLQLAAAADYVQQGDVRSTILRTSE